LRRTLTGRAFDLGLIFFILLSAVLVMLDSLSHIHDSWGVWLLGCGRPKDEVPQAKEERPILTF